MSPSTAEALSNPWTFGRKPALVAHRGYAQHFPENTLTALAAAVDAGAGFLEFDLQLSRDKVPFLMHDADLRRTAGVDASVFDLTMRELTTLPVGEPQRLGGRFHNVRTSTLEHVCTHLNTWADVHSFIEIKRQSIEHFGLDTVMEATLDAVRALNAPFTLLSFREDVVDYVNRHTTYQSGWVIRDWNQQSLDRLAELSPAFVFCNFTKIPDEDALPQGPWSWVLYEITDEALAAHWRSRGAHMIETMTVGRLLNAPLFAAP